MYHVVHYIFSNYFSYNWKFLSFDCLHPVPLPTTLPLKITNLILFFLGWLVGFWSDLRTMLVPGIQHSDLLFLFQYFMFSILVNICFSLYLWLYLYLFILFFRFHLQVKSYSVCLSLSDLLSMLISRSIHINGNISFFLWLNNIPLYICTTSSLSIRLLMGTLWTITSKKIQAIHMFIKKSDAFI